MKLKQIVATVFISALTAFGVMFVYSNYVKNQSMVGGQDSNNLPANYKYAGLSDGNGAGEPLDFTKAAAASIPTVVHIKTKTNARQVTNNLPRNRQQNPFSDFFGDDILDQFFGGGGSGNIPEQRASGSGVIISEDGYIVTNNHVIAKADELDVTLSNKKTYKAKVIGSDPAYDIAVIKIEAAGLPYLVYGNSDNVQVGQWVLAIGYPLNLETTVTAGIVSAKARSLGLNKDRSGKSTGAVESFIQTDAAVNQGNSGGALINTEGKLIGINSAIASPTGYYSGYSYAIPVNIAKKVVDDIIKFGTVQRGYLGISYAAASDMSTAEKVRQNIPENAFGIYVTDVPKDGAAYAGGIKKGDIIKKINAVNVNSGAEMQEQISNYKPGDKITVTYQRNEKEITSNITLKNSVGTFDVVTNDNNTSSLLGAEFTTLDNKRAQDLGVDGGIVVKKIKEGIINDQTRMRDNFIILKVDGKAVKSVEQFDAAISNKSNVTISGFYPGYDALYEYPIILSSN